MVMMSKTESNKCCHLKKKTNVPLICTLLVENIVDHDSP